MSGGIRAAFVSDTHTQQNEGTWLNPDQTSKHTRGHGKTAAPGSMNAGGNVEEVCRRLSYARRKIDPGRAVENGHLQGAHSLRISHTKQVTRVRF